MTTRRVVTGINAGGKSYFVHDGPTPGSLDLGGARMLSEIWIDDPSKPDLAAAWDPAASGKFSLEPPEGGSVVRVVVLPADSGDEMHSGAKLTAAGFDTGDAMEEEDPAMHTTRTIDYGIVLDGEVDLELDEGEVHLRPGDVIVQRATRHAWRNRGTAPCTIAFVLISSPNYR